MFRTQTTTQKRLFFTKAINGTLSAFCNVPKNTLVETINPETLTYYERNEFHPTYFRAKIIEWGDFDSQTEQAKTYCECQGNADVFVIVDTNKCIPEIPLS